MLMLAIILFMVAALFGGTALKFIIKNKKAPKPIGIIHGSFALMGLLFVISAAASGKGAVPIFSLIFLVLAALGGITIFILDQKKRPVPKIAAIIHPLLGLTGIISLIIFVMHA